jgi:hypothetical protein
LFWQAGCVPVLANDGSFGTVSVPFLCRPLNGQCWQILHRFGNGMPALERYWQWTAFFAVSCHNENCSVSVLAGSGMFKGTNLRYAAMLVCGLKMCTEAVM